MKWHVIIGTIGMISSLVLFSVYVYISNLINMNYLASVNGWDQPWTYFMSVPACFILGIVFLLSLLCCFFPRLKQKFTDNQ